MSEETSEKRSSSTGWVTGIVVALILYILALGPAMLLFSKGVIKPNSTVEKAFEICFWPLAKLIEHAKPVKSFYDAYFKALGIDPGVIPANEG